MADTETPAAAETIVLSAGTICENVDHLWRVLKRVSIPTDLLTDTREQGKVAHETEPMVRAFLYKEIWDLSQNELADQLEHRPSLSKGFDIDTTPEQQTISEIWAAFDADTKQTIRAAATGIAQEAHDHGVISEALVPTDPTEDADDAEDTSEYKREKACKTIELARRHAFPVFESGRASNRSYEDDEILDMFARICSHKGSANSEGEYGWLTDDDLTASGDTILRVLKEFGTSSADNAQLTFDELTRDDWMPEIERMRDVLMDPFDMAIENIINSIRGDTPFEDRKTVAAIDITHERIWIPPWEEYQDRVPNPDFPTMASGYRKDGSTRYGFKYATITLVGENVPIIFGVEPVKENSRWQDDESPSYSKARLVERLLDQAQQYVDLDLVMFDRGFDSHAVYQAVAERELTYLAPVKKYADDLAAIEDIRTTAGVDAGVLHDVPFGVDGETHHTAELLYVPVDDDDAHEAEGNYGAFATNMDHVAPNEIDAVVDRYSRRWDIESEYKSITEMMPQTSSMDYRVRFTNFVLTTLLYNLWRLTDYLVKVGMERAIRSAPIVSFKTFIRALTEYLRDID